eukprot:COSAG01_NODE_20_length_38868_cov_34.606071_1_plen_99_part_00
MAQRAMQGLPAPREPDRAPLVDGLSAKYNQSLDVQISAAVATHGDIEYRIDVTSSICTPPAQWSVLRTFTDVRPAFTPAGHHSLQRERPTRSHNVPAS